MNLNAVHLSFDKLEAILNGGLRVLGLVGDIKAGEEFAMQQEGQDEADRIFYARVDHVFPLAEFTVVQFTVKPFMRALMEERGKEGEARYETLPMTGEFANEKIAARDFPFAAKVTGEKPVWLYEAEKWAAEVSLLWLRFQNKVMLPTGAGIDYTPDEVEFKISQRGGEKLVRYIKAS